ncbi:MAG: DUF429 domain-containing protein [bacterium]|nr:DUF429 domain-containing protein [bacterium]MDE0601407.1 DUF429 domain-containing protein [bacterium]
MNGSTSGHSWALVGGVDGVPGRGRSARGKMSGGWVMVVAGVVPGSRVEEVVVKGSFADLWAHACKAGLLAVTVDIPIGLPATEGRTADRDARHCLKGPPSRSSSVFPTPPLSSINASTYEDAQKLARRSTGKGISRQTYALFPKIRDVRCAVQPDAFDPRSRPRVAEVHPEVSFQAMACQPMCFHKRFQAGVAERLALLECDFPNLADVALRTRITGRDAAGLGETLTPGLDDVLDAVAAAWTARRLIQGRAKRLGGSERDPDGYPMNIWA